MCYITDCYIGVLYIEDRAYFYICMNCLQTQFKSPLLNLAVNILKRSELVSSSRRSHTSCCEISRDAGFVLQVGFLLYSVWNSAAWDAFQRELFLLTVSLASSQVLPFPAGVALADQRAELPSPCGIRLHCLWLWDSLDVAHVRMTLKNRVCWLQGVPVA